MKNGAVRLNHEKHLEGRNFYSVFVPFSAERFFKQKKILMYPPIAKTA
jgi:hypothetical protein